MKNFLFFCVVFFAFGSPVFSQSKTAVKAALAHVQSGNGDIPGGMLMAGIQQRVSRRIGYEILASGTAMRRIRDFGDGYTVDERSNGLSLEGNFNFFVNYRRFSFYPSLGPVVRFARERHPQDLTIWSNASGRIISFEPNIKDEHEFQFGYTLGLNLDGRVTDSITLGLKAAVQDYHTGQMLAFVGFTIKNSGWPF